MFIGLSPANSTFLAEVLVGKNHCKEQRFFCQEGIPALCLTVTYALVLSHMWFYDRFHYPNPALTLCLNLCLAREKLGQNDRMGFYLVKTSPLYFEHFIAPNYYEMVLVEK